MKNRSSFLVGLSLTILWSATPAVWSQVYSSPSAFNFQGRLYESGLPANNLYDLQFRLFDAETNGQSVGPLVSWPGVAVSNGSFSGSIDFGSNAFTGAPRWVEIQQRVAGAGPIITLPFRVPVAPTPYAIHAYSADRATVALSSAPGTITGDSIALGAICSSNLCPNLLDSTFWKLLGNTGTDPAVNFLGTIDNKALTIRVNNSPALRIRPAAAGPNLIGGHPNNDITSGEAAIIAGGANNLVAGSASFSAISGGSYNAVTKTGGVVGGGSFNQMDAYTSVIAGGTSNRVVGGFDAAIGGGHANYVAGDHSVIGGGSANAIYDQGNTIAGGSGNRIGGGQVANPEANFIGGGSDNTIDSDFSVIAGGDHNEVAGHLGFIGGGNFNHVSGESGTISGGGNNFAGQFGTVAGGLGNFALGQHAAITGGQTNYATGDFATVGGGQTNHATGLHSAILGGQGNFASGPKSVIGGGAVNTAGALNSVIGGGQANYIGPTNSLAVIGGGTINTNVGPLATVLNGNGVLADKYGQVAFGTRFAANGDAQAGFYHLRLQTVGVVTNQPMYLDGTGARLTVSPNSAWAFRALVIGKASGATVAAWELKGMVMNNGGTTTLVQTTPTLLGGSSSLSAYAAADDANDALLIRVASSAAGTVRWSAQVETAEVNMP